MGWYVSHPEPQILDLEQGVNDAFLSRLSSELKINTENVNGVQSGDYYYGSHPFDIHDTY